MKVLVTGGAGYVGYGLVGELAADPQIDEIVVFDNLSRRHYAVLWGKRTGGRSRFVEADILDERTLTRSLAGIDAVVHLAAAVHVPGRDGEAHAFDQVNNWGSAQVAGAIERTASVEHVVYLSSVAVYGESAGAVSATTSSPRPGNFYGVTKLRGEAHFTRLANTDRRVHVVRSGNVYGINPAARLDSVVNRFLLDGRFKRRLRVEGTGDQTRSFIHVRRLTRALAALLTSDLPSATYDFVDTTRSVLEVAGAIQAIDPEVELIFVDQDMRMQMVAVRPSPELHTLTGPPPADFDAILRDEWDGLGL